MNIKKHFWVSLGYATGVVIYVLTLVGILFSVERIFPDGVLDSAATDFLAPVLFLLTFVVSATITGGLVLGKPIHLYLQGEKKEAVLFLAHTLVWLIIYALLLFVVIINASL